VSGDGAAAEREAAADALYGRELVVSSMDGVRRRLVLGIAGVIACEIGMEASRRRQAGDVGPWCGDGDALPQDMIEASAARYGSMAASVVTLALEEIGGNIAGIKPADLERKMMEVHDAIERDK